MDRTARPRQGWRRPRRIVPLAVAAVCAAALALAPALMGRTGAAGDPTGLARAEGAVVGHVYRHAETPAAVRRERARLRACRTPRYRQRHWAACPASAGALPTSAGFTRAQAVDSPTSMGEWAALSQVPSLAINSVVLPTGKVLWFSRVPEHQGASSYLYDPATGETAELEIPEVTFPNGETLPANIWCGGQVVLPDGRVLVAGGNLSYPWGDQDPTEGRGFKGAAWVFIFDPWTETWSRLRRPDGTPWDMVRGRWYPTLVSLSDGRVVIMAGWDESGHQVNVREVEVFTPRATPGGQDTLATVGSLPASHPWLNLYPHAFLLPSTTVAGQGGGDRVLVAGPGTGDAFVLHAEDWSWHPLADGPSRSRSWGTAVLEPEGTGGSTRVTLIGGSDTESGGGPPARTATTEYLDLNDPGWAQSTPAPTWREGPSLNHARSHLNTVLLPDGALLSLGGGLGQAADGSLYAEPVYQTELLDRGAAAWRDVAKEDDARTYHSSAVLLPDGRVLSAGDDRTGHVAPGGATAQVYSPPYLFGGERPQIVSAPAAVRQGASFRIAVADPAGVARAVLVRPGSATHSTDMDQRSIELAMTAQADGLTLTAPMDATVAPSGYYMLFVLDADGVPSIARWVRVAPDAPESPALPARPAAGPPGTPVPGTPPPGWEHARGPRLSLRSVRATRTGRAVTATVRLVSDGDATLRATLAPTAGARAVRLSRAPATTRLAAGRVSTVTVRARLRGTTVPRRLHLELRASDALGRAARVRRTIVLRASPPRPSDGSARSR